MALHFKSAKYIEGSHTSVEVTSVAIFVFFSSVPVIRVLSYTNVVLVIFGYFSYTVSPEI